MAQQFICKTGKVHFFSATVLENIEATSNTAICALNTSSKKVYSKIFINSFRFRDKLMEEHFNENYLESHIFNFGILDGQIQDTIDFTKDGEYNVTAQGSFEIHGVRRDKTFAIKLLVKDGVPLRGTSKFNVKLEDYKIKIPTAVSMKIAEALEVDVDFTFEKYEKKQP